MPDGYVKSTEVIGQPIEAVRYGLRETVIYLANGKQIIVEAQVVGARPRPGSYAVASTAIV